MAGWEAARKPTWPSLYYTSKLVLVAVGYAEFELKDELFSNLNIAIIQAHEYFFA